MHPASLLSNGFFLSLSLCLDIGIVNVAILSRTLSHGFKPGFWLGLGSCVGDLVHATHAGAALLRGCHVVSALLFAYLAYSVIGGGHRDLIAHAPQVAA